VIIFDLKCVDDHVFEAWFGSSDDFKSQKARGLLCCPVCGKAEVSKAAMAPAVSAKSNQSRHKEVVVQSESQQLAPGAPDLPVVAGLDASKASELINKIAKVQADILKNSEWVGDKFADTARAMHYGETDAKPIHGEVGLDEARTLLEEGVEVAPLPLPVVSPKARN
jgi:hypothetical protein